MPQFEGMRKAWFEALSSYVEGITTSCMFKASNVVYILIDDTSINHRLIIDEYVPTPKMFILTMPYGCLKMDASV